MSKREQYYIEWKTEILSRYLPVPADADFIPHVIRLSWGSAMDQFWPLNKFGILNLEKIELVLKHVYVIAVYEHKYISC